MRTLDQINLCRKNGLTCANISNSLTSKSQQQLLKLPQHFSSPPKSVESSENKRRNFLLSMDSPSPSNNSRQKPPHEVLLWCSFALGFFFISILSLFYAFGFFALLFANFSIPPISLPSQCKIISTSVDLRSSKICELGLLNYKAKRVFYPSERRKFRCRYEYYWASIFQVQYRDRFSGQTLLGLAEAPKEALPRECRPNFSTAWLTKHMLKVNETYDCWYTSGRSKVEILEDSYFGCQAKDPSLYEMMRRYSIIFKELLQFWLSSRIKSKHVRWEVILGGVGGFLTGIMSIILLTLCGRLLCSFPRAAASMIISLIQRVVFSRVFFFVAYFSIVGWLAIQYGQRLGLTELFVDY